MSTPNIRNADLSDLKEIMDIYEYARKFMKQTGNRNQWANKFPPENLIKEDIEKKQLYIIEKSGFICGVFAFIIGNDPTYSIIKNGEWLSYEKYGTVHRVASNGKSKGIFNEIITFCESKISHLRIDTHKDNKIMQHLIEKNGFYKCGIIYVTDGTSRLAYEKI
ncbi:hypothetical protein [Pseudoleptotrichia goodfellowii]|uniref:N-acetyltransferase domain-containing protein n=1 Tax=Pseudoleptotrichia goodfellowii F0264 TaxID=596323 RepID=D0GM05_9FUSO|nr:hypothetical protein [Pseudoleptotrichia goodfellowii]EEY34957.1 hypothetical protein HMPREF0554_1716 [Pseudoleptotrichia goodfellowii F0264]